jgi:hypothetical protein
MQDFTLTRYNQLIKAFAKAGYTFQTVEEFATTPALKAVILRHDVDSWPKNALQMAQIEHNAGAQATYYFRTSPLSFNEEIIRNIATLGHEIGYHYEDLSACNGDLSKAIKSFERHLELFRKFYPVKTIAMHGKPLSRWNNLDMLNSHDYHKYDLVAEPYLSLNFDDILYLTDTGNCWDGNKYSIRDNVASSFKFQIHTTRDLLNQLDLRLLPVHIMLNVHPARWNDNMLKWIVRYYILTLPKYQLKKWVKTWRNN